MEYSISGKVFILGEYAALMGLPSLIAAVPPRFKLSVGEENSEIKSTEFHAGSPVFRLQQWAKQLKLPSLKMKFDDPIQGAGGFGASTAQFAMAYLAYSQSFNEDQRQWLSVWKLYRELMSSDPVIPSGADLVSQWQGGVVYFDPQAMNCFDLWQLFDWSNLLVFSSTGQIGRKVPTHEHLKSLKDSGITHSDHPLAHELEQVLTRGVSAVRENQVSQLGEAMNEYAEVLYRSNLELPATTEDRKFLKGLPGVCGVKGAGALQADAVLVLLESSLVDRERVISAAKSRGLTLFADGLTYQAGVSCLN